MVLAAFLAENRRPMLEVGRREGELPSATVV